LYTVVSREARQWEFEGWGHGLMMQSAGSVGR
jgi:hypothetical protein